MDKQDTGAMSPVKKDAPVMKAWENYKATDDFQNTRRWALHEAHVDGSLWAAFYAGYFACAVNEQTQQSALTADAGMERAAKIRGMESAREIAWPYNRSPNDAREAGRYDAAHRIDKAIRAASAKVNAEGRCKHEFIDAPQVSDGPVCHKCGEPESDDNEVLFALEMSLEHDERHQAMALKTWLPRIKEWANKAAPSAHDAGQVVVPVDPQRYVWTRDGMMSVTGNGEYVSSIIFDALQQVLKAEIHKHEITKQLFDEELADGDKLCSSLCFERTEGGRLPVRKMVADIGDVAMRCKRAEAEASERDALLRAADAIRAEAAKPSTTDTKHR